MSTSQIFKIKNFSHSLLKGTVLNIGLQLANRNLSKKNCQRMNSYLKELKQIFLQLGGTESTFQKALNHHKSQLSL